MNIHVEKKSFSALSPQSIMIANQARAEQRKVGHITVKCPECNMSPEITMTSRGERTIIKCPCGYVKSVEINL